MNLEEKMSYLTSFGLGFDHSEHNVLYQSALKIKDVPGIVCEIGLRTGGGLGMMMLGCIATTDVNRVFIAVDPYGQLPYIWKENVIVEFDYTNSMKNKTLSALYNFVDIHNLHFDFYCMEDTTFFEKFNDGIPVYRKSCITESKYALVHLDGPHAVNEIRTELEFFKSRISLGGYIVLDDVTGHYDLSSLEKYLLSDDTFILDTNDGKKASYKKVK